MNHLHKPKFCHFRVEQSVEQGELIYRLQNQFRLTDAYIKLPQFLTPLVILCDGTNTLSQIRDALETRYNLRFTEASLENIVAQFDQALLLEGTTLEQVRQQVVADYRAAPFRPPLSAGQSYPAEPEALRQMLQGYLDQANHVAPVPATSRAIISPHIDYQRGGSTYAQVWASAAEAARQAELVIILGTDHNGGQPATITLTCQNYASPLGIMPTDQGLVARLAEALGPETVFGSELLHREEWSIELVLVWLQYMRGDQPCPVLPVLCGSFFHFMTGEARIEDEPKFKVFLDILREEMGRRRTLVVASGDLAHMGPAFDGPPLDAAAYAQMKVDDATLMDTLAHGNADSFFRLMQAGQYERNVCGLSPFYFTLSVLGQSQGQIIAYDRCPADRRNTSFVSICGMALE